MKKRKVNWKTAGVVTAGVGFLVLGGLMYGKMKELTNQLAYLQDSTNIILSDVSGMQSNIEKTLQKEASMIEAYSINVTGMDFSQMVYKVEPAFALAPSPSIQIWHAPLSASASHTTIPLRAAS